MNGVEVGYTLFKSKDKMRRLANQIENDLRTMKHQSRMFSEGIQVGEYKVKKVKHVDEGGYAFVHQVVVVKA